MATSIVECSDASAAKGDKTGFEWLAPLYLEPLLSREELDRAGVGVAPLHSIAAESDWIEAIPARSNKPARENLVPILRPAPQAIDNAVSEIRPHRTISPNEGAAIRISAIVPIYNERRAVAQTIHQLTQALDALTRDYEIILVDDGSTDGTAEVLNQFDSGPNIRVLRNERNRGYGFSLKRAARAATFDTVLIVDADGTYPIARLGDLLDKLPDAEMVVGSRVGKEAAVPLVRRPAKWVLRKLAEYLTGAEIPDLNSGFRLIRRGLVERFAPLLPDGFSFTTTITLAALTHDYAVRYVPIEYARRIGHSSIRPIRDTLNFTNLILRTVLYFKPFKVFAPASAALFAAAVLVALGSKFIFGEVADVTAVTLAVASFNVLAIGMLADLIEKRSPAYRQADASTPIHRRDAGATPISAGDAIGSPRSPTVAARKAEVTAQKETTSLLKQRTVARTHDLDAWASPGLGQPRGEPGYTFAAEQQELLFTTT